ncbi:MAG: hypothetical protein V3W04_13765 [Gammaproteobacteria bacterium]
MTKNECEKIGYIFSIFVSGEMNSKDLMSKIFDLDSRIKDDFEAFGDCRERDAAINRRYADLMTNHLGPDWAIKKACTSELS